jgi:Fic family protein
MYIYELQNWPSYTYDAAVLLPKLEAVNLSRGRLFGRLESIGFDEIREPQLKAFTQEVIKSSAIEGETLDVQSVRNSVARRLGMDHPGFSEQDRYVDGLVEMAMDAAQRYDQPLTAERIFNWHAALFPTGRTLYGPVTIGRWRTNEKGPMVVASQKGGREILHFEAPSAERLPEEMSAFLAWVAGDNESSLILKAGIAHLWFETLHPLDDGNGRVGRNIMDLLLARADRRPVRPYSLASSIHRYRNAYYTALERSQSGTLDYTYWLSWYLDTLTAAIEEAIQTVEQAVARTQFWQRHRETNLNDRQRKTLSKLLMGWEGKLTNKKYANLTRCSDATATRDLVDLVAKGVLRSTGAGGRSVGYELADRAEL